MTQSIAAEFALALGAQGTSTDAKGASSRPATQASVYRQLAQQRCSELYSVSAFGSEAAHQRTEASRWNAERNTWDLLERLSLLRRQANINASFDSASTQSEDMQTACAPAATTDYACVQELVASDALLAEYVEVRRWLEDTAPEFQPVETRKGYRFYTRRCTGEHGMRASSDAPGGKPNRIVTETDPDAASRQRRELAHADAEYEAGLLRTLYEYVRRGRVGNAMDLCAESDEPWRAASIKGGLLWRDPQLEPDGGMAVDSDENGPADMQPAHTAGNVNRRLWKHACAALAHDEGNDSYERALYAALSGRLDEVVPVCESWADAVWAHVNSMIETRIESSICDGSQLYAAAPTQSFGHIQSRYPPVDNMQQVFGVVASHDSDAWQTEAREPLCWLQQALITDSFPAYLDDYARRLGPSGVDDGSSELLRVVVHVALYLRQLEFALPADAARVVLEAYIDVLAQNHRELVAAYVPYLPVEAQTEAYAQFLSQQQGTRAERVQLLELAEQHGLDTEAISKRTVELVIDRHASSELPGSSHADQEQGRFALAEPAEAISAGELEQVRAIEWVTNSPGLYEHALVVTCTLARRFLLGGRTNAAAQLFNALPPDFVQPLWVEKAQSI
ncbi:Nucleoporin nup84, partial [Coemansia sp. RSA 2704]